MTMVFSEDFVTLSIRLLGPPALERDGRLVAAPRGRKAWAVLAYLLLAERPPGRRQLAELLFGDADDPLGALRWTLAELRRALGTPELFGGDPVATALGPGLEVDVRALTQESDEPDNLPLLLDEQQVGLEYAKITGAQSVTWDGEEVTLLELHKVFQYPDRDRRRIATLAIGRLFGEDSVDRLEAALRDPDREVRLVAVNAFGRLRLPGTAPLLERVAQEDQDSTVRQEAARVAAALQGVAGEVP